MCIEKKNPSVDCAKAEEGLQTTDFRLQTSYFRQFIKKNFLESEVRGLKNEAWSLKSKVLLRFRTIVSRLVFINIFLNHATT